MLPPWASSGIRRFTRGVRASMRRAGCHTRPGMADALSRALGADGRGRLLDIGCGPGIVAFELASMFDEVVGLDADAEMIAEAEAQARRRGLVNARWVHLRAEELPAGLGRFCVAHAGAVISLDGSGRAAADIHAMLEPAGGLVHISAYTRRGIETTSPLPHPQPPWDAITELSQTAGDELPVLDAVRPRLLEARNPRASEMR